MVIPPDLSRDAQLLAAELLVNYDASFKRLADQAARAGRLRAATQLLHQAGETAAAQEAWQEYLKEWGAAAFTDDDLGRLETYAGLLRHTTGSQPSESQNE